MWIPGNYSEDDDKKANYYAKQASSSIFSKTHSIHLTFQDLKNKSNITYLIVWQQHWSIQHSIIHKIKSSIFYCFFPSNKETLNNTNVQELMTL